MFSFMGSKRSERSQIVDREFPVRLTIRSDPTTYETTRQWLQRHFGAENYATLPQVLWSDTRALCLYFGSVHAALMFLAGCPHIQLIGERYTGAAR